jgi:hypothetical protein
MHDRDVIDMLIEIIVAGRGGGAVDLNQPPFKHLVEASPPRRNRGSSRSGSTRKGMVRATARRAYEPKKKKPTAANKAYSRCFKKLKPKYMKKSGGWKQDGFKRCVRAAHKCARRGKR